jgi:FkbM family methyltransferase
MRSFGMMKKIQLILVLVIVLTMSISDNNHFLNYNIRIFVSGQQIHSLLRAIAMRHPMFKPDVAIDIGANAGKYTNAIRQLFPDTKIIMVEASQQHENVLRNFTANDSGKSEFHINVLSNKDGQIVEFFDSIGANTGNSMFRESSKHFTNLKPVKKVTKTIDTIVKESNLFSPGSIVDLIKADVQGAELLVFEGATDVLRQATFVQFEGSTIEWNDGGSCWYHVDELLRSHGFYLYDLGDFMFNPKAFKTSGLGQFDIMYVKPSSPRLPEIMKANAPKFCGVNRTEYLIEKQKDGTIGSNDSSALDIYLGFLCGVSFSLMVYVFTTSSLISKQPKFKIQD